MRNWGLRIGGLRAVGLLLVHGMHFSPHASVIDPYEWSFSTAYRASMMDYRLFAHRQRDPVQAGRGQRRG